MRWRGSWPLLALAAMVLARSFYLALACYRRLRAFRSYWPIDVANVNQAIWNTAHGKPLCSTILYQGPRDHFDPVLALLSPAYAFTDNTFWVFLLYSIVIGSGAFAVFFLARKLTAGTAIPVLLAVHYLTFAPLVELNVLRLKGDVLAVPFLLFAFYFYAESRFRGFVLFAGLALLCKESVAVVMLAWGLLALIQRRQLRWVLAPLLAGACVILFTLLVYHPYIQGYPYKHARAISEDFGLSSVASIQSATFLARRCFPYYGAVALLDPVPLVPAVPLLVASFLWHDMLQHDMWFHVLAPVLPFLFVAVVSGTGRLLALLGRVRRRAVLVGLLLVGSVVAAVAGSLDLYELPRQSAEDRAVWELIDRIPRSSSVSAPPLVLPALSTRRVLHSLVNKDWRAQTIDVLAVDWVLLDAREVVWSREVSMPNLKALDARYFEAVAAVRSHPAFELVEKRLDWELYRRKGPPR